MKTAPSGLQRGAAITEDGRYRYSLTRSWDPDVEQTWELHRPVVWIGLNPSTADGSVDDPTIRRCIRFTRDMGHCHLTMVNLFAYRATDPGTLIGARAIGVDIVGPLNDQVIMAAAEGASVVIAAWGAQRFARDRTAAVLSLIDPEGGTPLAGTPVTCLGRTADGHPLHPLHIKSDTPLEVLRG